ncbi:hypothetical protein [Streptomyces lydicus]
MVALRRMNPEAASVFARHMEGLVARGLDKAEKAKKAEGAAEW